MENAYLCENLYSVNHRIDEAVRGVQRLQKSPELLMETYQKFMTGLERHRSRINLRFMIEMRRLEEGDEFRFEEDYDVWSSDEPLTSDEIYKLMRTERERKPGGKPPVVQFLPRSKRPKKMPEKTGEAHPIHKLTGSPTRTLRVENATREDGAHA